MKSAYELALERLEKQGIAPPKENSLTEETREGIAEARRRAEAKLAELEILHKGQAPHGGDPQAEDEYLRERRRIEEKRDREIDKLRRG